MLRPPSKSEREGLHGKRRKGRKAGAAVAAAKTTQPYVQRLIEDEELRQNIMQAYDSARNAYEKLSDGKSPASAVFEDKKLQSDLQNAAVALRQSAHALKDAPKASKGKGKKKGPRLGRKLLLVVVAGGLALALSEGLRKKALDALFGAEEEFEYTSPTTPRRPRHRRRPDSRQRTTQVAPTEGRPRGALRREGRSPPASAARPARPRPAPRRARAGRARASRSCPSRLPRPPGRSGRR